eukprot:413273-Lingulodinium_polyedra.AAC.1
MERNLLRPGRIYVQLAETETLQSAIVQIYPNRAKPTNNFGCDNRWNPYPRAWADRLAVGTGNLRGA